MYGKPSYSSSPHRLLSFPSFFSIHFFILPSSPLKLLIFSIYFKLFLQVKQCKERGVPTPCLCGCLSCKEMKHSQLDSMVCFLLHLFLPIYVTHQPLYLPCLFVVIIEDERPTTGFVFLDDFGTHFIYLPCISSASYCLRLFNHQV